MTSYEPPTSNLAIFDSTVFQTDNEPLTIAEANKRYLKFPTAQGDETLLNATILGDLTFNDTTSISSANMTVVDLNYVSNPTDLTSTNLYNTRFRLLSGIGGWDIYIPSTILKPINRDSYFIIENTTTTRAELRLTDTVVGSTSTTYFTGKYGSYATNETVSKNSLLEIAPQSTYVIFIGQTNMFVQQRMSEFTVFRQAYPIASNSTYDRPNYFDTIIEITTGAGINGALTLPDPRSSISPYSFDRQIKVSNYHTSPLRLTTSNSVNIFGGKYGNSDDEINLPPNTSYVCLSNGTTWEINERSGDNITYQSLNLDLSTTLDYALHYNLLGATHNISATTGGTILYPNPSDNKSVRTTSIIRNIGSIGINIQIGSGAFTGKYGSGVSSTVYFLPANSWIQLYSDGTNYRVDDRSSAPLSYTTTAGTRNISSYLYYTDCDFTINPDANDITVTIASPVGIPNQSYKIINNSATSIFSLTPSAGSSFLGKYGSGTTTIIVPANSWVKLVSNGTNWFVDDRSSNFNLYQFETGGDLTWTSNFQYLDTTVEFVQPDSVYSPLYSFSGTSASQTGYIITITTISTGSGTITAGSVIILAGNTKCIIKCQLTGTAGADGTYLTNVSRSIGATTFTGNGGGSGRVTTNTITTFALGQTTNYPVATFPVAMRNASIVSIDSRSVIAPFYIYRQSSGTIYEVTAGATGIALSGATYFSTSGTSVRLPTASNVSGRSITIVNSSNNPLDITTVAGTSLFNGLYGQLLGSSGVFPNRYLLRPSETVVLKSDGTNWETQVGTSLGGARWWGGGSVSTTGADYSGIAPGSNIASLSSNYSTLDTTVSNLSGLEQVGGVFTNFYPFPITVNVAPNIYWNRGGASTNVIPIRVGEIRHVTNSVTGAGQYYSPTGITVYNNVPCTVATTTTPNALPAPAYSTATSTTTYTPTGAANFFVSFNGLFTLRSGDTITINIAKINGGIAASVDSSTVYINRVA